MPAPIIIRNAKNLIRYSTVQVKVRDATSNEAIGPSLPDLVNLAVYSYSPLSFNEMLQILSKRIHDSGKNWRHIYKSLQLFEFLCIHGGEHVLDHCKRTKYAFEMLRDFRHLDKENGDVGIYIRDQASRLIELLDNEQALKTARESDSSVAKMVSDALHHGGMLFTPRSRSYDVISSNRSHPIGMSHLPNAYTPRYRCEPPSNRKMSNEMAKALPKNADEEEAQLRIALAISEEEIKRKNISPMNTSTNQSSSYNYQHPQTSQANLIDFSFSPPPRQEPPVQTQPTFHFDPFAKFPNTYSTCNYYLFPVNSNQSTTPYSFLSNPPLALPQTNFIPPPGNLSQQTKSHSEPSFPSLENPPALTNNSVDNNIITNFLGKDGASLVDLEGLSQQSLAFGCIQPDSGSSKPPTSNNLTGFNLPSQSQTTQFSSQNDPLSFNFNFSNPPSTSRFPPSMTSQSQNNSFTSSQPPTNRQFNPFQ